MFTFSAPKSCQTAASQSSMPHLRPLLPAVSKPTEVPKMAPLFTNGSVLDALRKPEFQPFGKGPSVSATKNENVIDLTEDENRGGDKVSVVFSWGLVFFYIILYCLYADWFASLFA